MLAAERKLKILDYVRKHNVASVSQLSQDFGVHEATIRRDLSEIEKEGRIRRTHGGVVLVEGVSSEPSFTIRANERVEEKIRIAECAVEMIEEGDNIILDSGTTTLQIARLLVAKSNITVVTNDINIAAELRDFKDIKVIVTGGILYPESYMLNGLFTDNNLKTLHVDKAFVGIPAFHPNRGLTHFDDQLVSAKQSMIEAASQTIVVTDHTKLGGISLHKVAPVNEIDVLITGREASETKIRQFKEAGLTVYTV
ncbi:DeoR/GlpR family DNA-binding transcription regulator [Niallia sp. NCCP-28]|uniref:DeoR/GlpR family DNA-binding transcription regulator n=1 Tax=Niallia sp. NCCP-28 TaxID=2934712 RepID=UPI00208CA783|nr:DeoR/GlpR family DNA-binding transcription regulator [Niallia sp. NCCP-28]GKU83901.1 DeoR family transcriptional regulator [Niallia sp. NCCP-28]